MIRALPRPLDWTPLAWAGWVLVALAVAWNLARVADLAAYFPGHHGFDWTVLSEAAELSNPYDQPWYLWSPVAVYPLRLLAPLGEVGMWVLHVLALIPLGWPLGGIVFASFPFWFDLYNGNVMIFIAVCGVLAMRGNHVAVVAFYTLALLIPRPLMLPLTVWLLWREPWSRWWAGGLFIIHAALVMASGIGPDWIARLADPPGVATNPGNLVAFLGIAWVPVGLTIAVIAFRFGWIGVASVAVQPYVWSYYLLMLLLDARRLTPESNSR